MGVIYWSLSMGIMGLMSEPLVTMGVVGDLSKSKTKWNMCIFCFNFPKYFLCVFLGSFSTDMRGICWYLEP